ncbi:MAG: radical SAM protein [Clostridium sp.]|nr:radical SAM protein [Clostridium sp.]
MGLNLKWDVTYKCNLFCKHCINASLLSNSVNELETNEIKSIVEKICSNVDIDYIHFLGGEPTTRKDLVEIFDFLEQKNIYFGFNTNCINFKLEKYEKVLKNKKLRNIIVSIEGPNAQINDSIRGKNVFDIIIRNLKSIIKFKKDNNLNQFIITVNTVVSKANYEYIIDMIDFCIEIGVDELVLLQLIKQGNAESSDACLTTDEEIDLVGRIAKYYQEVKDKLIITPKFVRPIAKEYCEKVLGLPFPVAGHTCGAGTNFAFLNNLGYMYPCDRYLYNKIGGKTNKNHSLKDNNFFDVWSNLDFNEAFEVTEGKEYEVNLEPCNRCKFFKNQCYPCYLTVDLKNKKEVKDCSKFFELIEGAV